MCRWSVGTATALLVLGLAGWVRAEDPDDDEPPPAKPAWYQRLLPFKKKAAAPPAPQPSRETPAPAPVQPSPAQVAAILQNREKAAVLRRLAVCDKLREIALVREDDELRRKADQLDQRAWDMYLKHTAQLPLGTSLQTDQAGLQGRQVGAGQSLLPARRRGNPNDPSEEQP